MVRRRACWAADVMESASSRMIILCLFFFFLVKYKDESEVNVHIIEMIK